MNTLMQAKPPRQMIFEHGMDGLAEAFRILLNEAMVIERSQALGAAPFERTEERTGYANGFKDKSVKTRFGKIRFDIPQTRGVGFYPSALERGLRSERALTLAVAEMYLNGARDTQGDKGAGTDVPPLR